MPRERKKVLILDDCEERHDLFGRHLKLYGIRGHHTRHVKDALDNLRRYEYKYVFLDHDLGLSDGYHTGMEVVDDVVTTERRRPGTFPRTLFVIHSMNAPAAEEMVHRLRQAGLNVKRVPLAWEVLAEGERKK